MATVRRFEDLECWKEARELVKAVYAYTENEKFRRDFELKTQIRRSAVSLMANIAEGFHRRSDKDFVKFLDYARASAAETLSHGYVAYDQNYVDEITLKIFKEKIDRVWKKLNAFMSYLTRMNQATKSTRPTNRPNGRIDQ